LEGWSSTIELHPLFPPANPIPSSTLGSLLPS
jgi:hypothetical protein